MSEPIRSTIIVVTSKVWGNFLGLTSCDNRSSCGGQTALFMKTEKEIITVTIGTCPISDRLVNEREGVEVGVGKDDKIEALGQVGSFATLHLGIRRRCVDGAGHFANYHPAAPGQVFKLIWRDGMVINRFVR